MAEIPIDHGWAWIVAFGKQQKQQQHQQEQQHQFC